MAKKSYSSVADMVRGLSDSPDVGDTMTNHLAERQITNKLLALRAAKGLSQKQVAEHFGCTQSRISKLESSVDSEWSLGDVSKYAEALGLRIEIIFSRRDASEVDLRMTRVEVAHS